MGDVTSRVQRAETARMRGDHARAVEAYLGVFSDIEKQKREGTSYFREAALRVDFARLLREVGDPREAEQLTRAAALFQRRGDDAGQVAPCLRMAELHSASQANALYWVDRAVACARRADDEGALRRATAYRGELLLAFDRVDEGLEALRSAVGMDGGHALRASLATALVRAGAVEQGRTELEAQLAEAERSDEPDAAARAVRLRIALADARRAGGAPDEALRLLREAEASVEALGDPDARALLMDRLGYALLEGGDPAGAVETLERGLAWARAATRPRASRLASLHHNLGNALAAIGSHEGAVRALSAAVRHARAAGATKSEALAHFALANVAARIGTVDRARHAYDEARGLAVRLGFESLEAACLDSLGQLGLTRDRAAHAVDLHRRAAELHAKAGDFEGQHTDLLNQAQAHLLLEEVDAARRALDAADRVAEAHLEAVPWRHRVRRGQVLAREGRWDDARAAFSEAIGLLEKERDRFDTPADQRRWAAHRVEAFEIAAAAAFEAGDARAALDFLEVNRGRFLEEVAERRRRLPPDLPHDVRDAWVAVTDRRAELRWRRRQRPDVVDADLERELQATEQEWRRLDAALHPFRTAAEPSARPVFDPERMAECLLPGEAAIALHVASEWTGAACVGRARDGSVWWECGTEAGLTLADVSRLIVGRAEGDEASTRPAWSDLAGLDREDAAALVASTCDRIGGRVWPLIEGLVDGRADALVLMPGRGLNVLPLHAAPSSDGTPAMERWAVRYVPSLSILTRVPAADLGADRVLVQAVDPTADLPAAGMEAAAIASGWRGTARRPLLRSEGTPEAVLRLFEQGDVLHFAGHGGFDPGDPLESRLECAPVDGSGAVTLRTILERVPEARARLVLLSACETGRVLADDPLNDQLGLPGGLLTAGTSAVLATFWAVSDLASCLVVSRCLRTWQERPLDLAEALAEAQRWLRTEATAGVVLAWVEEQLAGEDPSDLLLEMRDELLELDEDVLLFDEALDWAPFHVTGRGVRVSGVS